MATDCLNDHGVSLRCPYEGQDVPQVIKHALGSDGATEYGWEGLHTCLGQWLECDPSFDPSLINIEEDEEEEDDVIDFDDAATQYNVPRTSRGAKSHAMLKDVSDGPPVMRRAREASHLLESGCKDEIRATKKYYRIVNYLDYLSQLMRELDPTVLEEDEMGPPTESKEGTPPPPTPKSTRPRHVRLMLSQLSSEFMDKLTLSVELALIEAHLRYQVVERMYLWEKFTAYIQLLFHLSPPSGCYRAFISAALDKRISIAMKAFILSHCMARYERMDARRATLIAPSFALLISQSTRGDDGSSNSLESPQSDHFDIKHYLSPLLSRYETRIEQSINDDALWNHPDDGSTFPIGAIVCRNIPLVWRHTSALLWLCVAGPERLGGMDGARELVDDFHGVGRSSISSFTVRVLEHQVHHWNYDVSHRTVTFCGALGPGSLLHEMHKIWIRRAIMWFTVYHPNCNAIMKSTNITTDGTEAVAGDLEVGPVGHPSVFYANAIIEACKRDEDPYVPCSIVPAPFGTDYRAMMAIRNAMTLSIMCCSKVEHRSNALDHIDTFELIRSTATILHLCEPHLKRMWEEKPDSFGAFSLPINVIPFFVNMTHVLYQLRVRAADSVADTAVIYSAGLRVLSLVLGLLTPSDRADQCIKLLNLNHHGRLLDTEDLRSLFKEVLHGLDAISPGSVLGIEDLTYIAPLD